MMMENLLVPEKKRLLISSLLLCLSACDNTNLRPWHTEILESEYSGENAAEISSFEDYLSLEDTVFDEMDLRIYAESATGP